MDSTLHAMDNMFIHEDNQLWEEPDQSDLDQVSMCAYQYKYVLICNTLYKAYFSA